MPTITGKLRYQNENCWFMESSPGRSDVFLPSSIAQAWGLRLGIGQILTVEAHAKQHGRNNWRVDAIKAQQIRGKVLSCKDGNWSMGYSGVCDIYISDMTAKILDVALALDKEIDVEVEKKVNANGKDIWEVIKIFRSAPTPVPSSPPEPAPIRLIPTPELPKYVILYLGGCPFLRTRIKNSFGLKSLIVHTPDMDDLSIDLPGGANSTDQATKTIQSLRYEVLHESRTLDVHIVTLVSSAIQIVNSALKKLVESAGHPPCSYTIPFYGFCRKGQSGKIDVELLAHNSLEMFFKAFIYKVDEAFSEAGHDQLKVATRSLSSRAPPQLIARLLGSPCSGESITREQLILKFLASKSRFIAYSVDPDPIDPQAKIISIWSLEAKYSRRVILTIMPLTTIPLEEVIQLNSAKMAFMLYGRREFLGGLQAQYRCEIDLASPTDDKNTADVMPLDLVLQTLKSKSAQRSSLMEALRSIEYINDAGDFKVTLRGAVEQLTQAKMLLDSVQRSIVTALLERDLSDIDSMCQWVAGKYIALNVYKVRRAAIQAGDDNGDDSESEDDKDTRDGLAVDLSVDAKFLLIWHAHPKQPKRLAAVQFEALATDEDLVKEAKKQFADMFGPDKLRGYSLKLEESAAAAIKNKIDDKYKITFSRSTGCCVSPDKTQPFICLAGTPEALPGAIREIQKLISAHTHRFGLPHPFQLPHPGPGQGPRQYFRPNVPGSYESRPDKPLVVPNVTEIVPIKDPAHRFVAVCRKDQVLAGFTPPQGCNVQVLPDAGRDGGVELCAPEPAMSNVKAAVEAAIDKFCRALVKEVEDIRDMKMVSVLSSLILPLKSHPKFKEISKTHCVHISAKGARVRLDVGDGFGGDNDDDWVDSDGDGDGDGDGGRARIGNPQVLWRAGIDDGGRVVVELVQGNIVGDDSDIIVNSANASLLAMSGISAAIMAAAGPTVKDECDKAIAGKRLRPGDALFTSAGNIAGVAEIAHVHLNSAARTEAEIAATLRECLGKVLQRCDEKDHKSVCVPCLGTGIFGFKTEAAITHILDEFAAHAPRISSLTRLRLIVLSNAEATAAADLLLKEFPKAKKLRDPAPDPPAALIGVADPVGVTAVRNANDLVHFYEQATWYWHEDGSAPFPYGADVSNMIEKAYKADPNGRTQEFTCDSTKYMGGAGYYVDFQRMVQVNRQTRFERKVARVAQTVEVREDPSTAARGAIAVTASAIPTPTGTITLVGQPNDVAEAKKAVMKLMESFVIDKMVTNVPVRMLPQLRKKAAEFVVAARDNPPASAPAASGGGNTGTLVLSGDRDLVCRCETACLREILQAAVADRTDRLEVPAEWDPKPGDGEVHHHKLVTVAPGTAEWSSVEAKMRLSLPQAKLVELERIQNMWLWQAYSFQKGRMQDKTEVEVFHGTKSTDPRLIYSGKSGFDVRFSRDGLWGRGCYFAVNASYSDNGYAYTDSSKRRQLLLASVLVGCSAVLPQSDQTLKIPPRKKTGDGGGGGGGGGSGPHFAEDRYDSVKANTGGSDIYIIYDMDRAYPKYLISYTTN